MDLPPGVFGGHYHAPVTFPSVPPVAFASIIIVRRTGGLIIYFRPLTFTIVGFYLRLPKLPRPTVLLYCVADNNGRRGPFSSGKAGALPSCFGKYFEYYRK